MRFFAIAFLLLAACAPKNPDAWKSEDARILAYNWAEGFVEDRIQAKVRFPGIADGKREHVYRMSGDSLMYKVVSYYITADGRRVRFDCALRRSTESDWELISLDVFR